MGATSRRVTVPGGIELAVRCYDFTDPWHEAPTLLMLHGTAESGAAFRQWIPALARQFRLVVPDLRGMGESSPIPAGAKLSMDDLVGDTVALMDALAVRRCAVVGEKVGALLGLRLAARHPDRVSALALACGMVAPRDVVGPWVPAWIELIEKGGSRAWVDATQAGRMGDELEPAALEWWSALMASSARTSLMAYLRMLQAFALADEELRAVQAPTLFLTPAAEPPAGTAFEQRRPASELLAWQRLVAHHEIAPIDSASYHLAATRPDACAAACREFLLRTATRRPEGTP